MTSFHDDETIKIIDVGLDRINRLNDRFAKYLLAGPKSKPILLDFINGALLLDEADKIADLEVLSGELVQDAASMKLSVLDVSARLADGRTVDIEIQIVNRHDFRKRSPFYWAMRHVKKLESGMVYALLKPTITICLLAFDLLEEEEAYRNSYGIRNDKSGNRLCEDMQIIYLELPKFRRHLGKDCPKTGLERWLLYFSNEEGERMNKASEESTALAAAREMEAVFWADSAEKEMYFAHQRLLMDAYSDEHTHEVLLEQEREKAEKMAAAAAQHALQEGLQKGLEEGLEKGLQKGLAKGLEEGLEKGLEEGLQKGLEKGLEEGLEKGLEEGLTKVARNLLKKGIDINLIIEATGLSREDIDKLR
ncbi:MAG: Rpn family recombination-promoting nuclease/putative transposase [Synergistaceae bacterium]|jgi:predicted transposase/invertase (TIGR01784 family)|nr:Rpn family recombination-promoting nuclease/putative transposase [Synergistaceae bacterium]